jgi:Leucine-rich repeat (LRR) protein
MPRRTAAEIFSAAAEKVERARLRRSSLLNLGERRRSLSRFPSLAGLAYLRSLAVPSTGVVDLNPITDLPLLESLDLRDTPVWDLRPLVNLKLLKSLNLSGTSVTDLSPLSELPNLQSLVLEYTNVSDVSALQSLSKLSRLDVSSTRISDLTPLAANTLLTRLELRFMKHLHSLSALYQLKSLKQLNCTGTPISTLAPLAGLPLSTLDLDGTQVSDIGPLSSLHDLSFLDISRTKVSDLSPLKDLQKLHTLSLDKSQVADLSPLMNIRSLALSQTYGSLSFSQCPISDLELLRLSKAGRYQTKTLEVINYLRSKHGLAPFVKEGDVPREKPSGFGAQLPALENVPSPYSFILSADGAITLTSSSANWPIFPTATSAQDHENRLDACRLLATDLVSELESRHYQAREEYRNGLQKYANRLPTKPGDGNILLADAEARTIRNLFSAETGELSIAFASKLKTFLEQHIGLRVFYPEIAKFYRDVQTGRMQAPLSLDAVEGFIRGVQENSPVVFDETVRDVIEESADNTQQSFDIARQDASSPTIDELAPVPPRDPLGELDPKASSDFTFAGVANGIWRAFTAGEKVNKALAGWHKAGQMLQPHVSEILNWLHYYMSSGGGPPPTIGV